jgi:hypothetical protein
MNGEVSYFHAEIDYEGLASKLYEDWHFDCSTGHPSGQRTKLRRFPGPTRLAIALTTEQKT